MVVSPEGGEVPAGTPLTLALLAGVALIGVALWASARGGRAVEAAPATSSGPAAPWTSPADPENIGLLEARAPAPPVEVARPGTPDLRSAAHETETVRGAHFLPPELQVLAIKIPDQLAAFEDATPTERLHLARPLLASSIAVLMCAHGTGPLEPGAPGENDLSLVGQDGLWSFHLNDRTFHFRDVDFPEYAEYIPLLSSVYDDDMKLVSLTTELPEDLGERIASRAYEALSWL